jgi:hypothetical protein
MRNLVSACAGMVCVLALADTVRAQDPPDLTGVWVTYRGGGGGGRGGRGGAGLPFRPEARARVERYQAVTQPTADRQCPARCSVRVAQATRWKSSSGPNR